MRRSTGDYSRTRRSGCNVGDADRLGVQPFSQEIVGLLGGIIVVIRGEWLAGALLIFIITPITYGQYVAAALKTNLRPITTGALLLKPATSTNRSGN